MNFPIPYAVGHPLPVVRWVSEGEELIQSRILHAPDESLHLGSERPVSVRNAVLVLAKLVRRDDGRRLRCEAHNTNLTLGLHKAVTVTMHCEYVTMLSYAMSLVSYLLRPDWRWELYI